MKITPGYTSLPECLASINVRVMKTRTLEAMRTQGDYTEAIRLNPDFNLAYFNRSAVLRAMGKGFEAEQDFIRSLAPGKEPEVSLEPPIEGISATKATSRKIQ